MNTISDGDHVTISVRGVAFAEAAAERATVAIAVGYDGADRTDIRDRSSRTLALCIDSITQLHDSTDGPIVEWSSDDVRVWADRPWNSEGIQLPLVHHSRASVSATFVDFARFSVWLEKTASLDGVTVGGITWTVSDLTHRELEARAQRDAVAHAVDKATVYATALGLSTVTPRELSEPSVFAQPFTEVSNSRMFAMAAGAPLEFAPAAIRVDIEIHGRFTARA